MTVLLFHMRGVPDDEAEDVRALLVSNDIDFYETGAGSWGLSTPALWLRDEDQLQRARSLIDRYQAERSRLQREKFLSLKEAGRHITILQVMKHRPLRMAFCLAAVAFVLYISVWPFLSIGDP